MKPGFIAERIFRASAVVRASQVADDQRLFQLSEGDLRSGPEGEKALLPRQQDEAVVGEDRFDLPELREDAEGGFIRLQLQLELPVLRDGEAPGDLCRRQFAMLVFGQEAVAAVGVVLAVAGNFQLPEEELPGRVRDQLCRRKLSADPRRDLNAATYVSSLLTVVVGLVMSRLLFGSLEGLEEAAGFRLGFVSPWVAAAIGVAAGVIIGGLAELYTSADFSPTRRLAETAREGAALTITQGLALGMKSCMAPCVVLGAGIILSYSAAGMYGVSMAAVGMLSFVAATVSVDTYGPISDNAGGIAEMSGLPPEVRKITDTLDSVGNTTAAIGKGFAIGSGALAALALMISYLYSYNELGTELVLNMIDPMILSGAIVGGALPFLFSGMLIEAVAKAARKMVEEVRRQFREIPGILEGTAKPDYRTCIEISSRGALGEMRIPSLLAIVVPVLCGFLFGPEFVGGVIIGSTIAAIMIAIFTGNAGGAWDNGKQYSESAAIPGARKGSETHSAAVVGDTVGDPLKDTVGPCLDIFIKIMSTVSLVAVSVFSRYNLADLLAKWLEG